MNISLSCSYLTFQSEIVGWRVAWGVEKINYFYTGRDFFFKEVIDTLLYLIPILCYFTLLKQCWQRIPDKVILLKVSDILTIANGK